MSRRGTARACSYIFPFCAFVHSKRTVRVKSTQIALKSFSFLAYLRPREEMNTNAIRSPSLPVTWENRRERERATSRRRWDSDRLLTVNCSHLVCPHECRLLSLFRSLATWFTRHRHFASFVGVSSVTAIAIPFLLPPSLIRAMVDEKRKQ